MAPQGARRPQGATSRGSTGKLTANQAARIREVPEEQVALRKKLREKFLRDNLGSGSNQQKAQPKKKPYNSSQPTNGSSSRVQRGLTPNATGLFSPNAFGRWALPSVEPTRVQVCVAQADMWPAKLGAAPGDISMRKGQMNITAGAMDSIYFLPFGGYTHIRQINRASATKVSELGTTVDSVNGVGFAADPQVRDPQTSSRFRVVQAMFVIKMSNPNGIVGRVSVARIHPRDAITGAATQCNAVHTAMQTERHSITDITLRPGDQTLVFHAFVQRPDLLDVWMTSTTDYTAPGDQAHGGYVFMPKYVDWGSTSAAPFWTFEARISTQFELPRGTDHLKTKHAIVPAHASAAGHQAATPENESGGPRPSSASGFLSKKSAK